MTTSQYTDTILKKLLIFTFPQTQYYCLCCQCKIYKRRIIATKTSWKRTRCLPNYSYCHAIKKNGREYITIYHIRFGLEIVALRAKSNVIILFSLLFSTILKTSLFSYVFVQKFDFVPFYEFLYKNHG